MKVCRRIRARAAGSHGASAQQRRVVLEHVPGENDNGQPCRAVIAAGLEAGGPGLDKRINPRVIFGQPTRVGSRQSALRVSVERDRHQATDPSAQVGGVRFAGVGKRYVWQLGPEDRPGHSQVDPLARIHRRHAKSDPDMTPGQNSWRGRAVTCALLRRWRRSRGFGLGLGGRLAGREHAHRGGDREEQASQNAYQFIGIPRPLHGATPSLANLFQSVAAAWSLGWK